MSNYLYTYLLPESAKNIPRHTLIKICNKALMEARLEAPIVTGNLRRSINILIGEQKDLVIMYIDNKYYPNYEYYIKVNEVPNSKGSNGYWQRCIEKFKLVIFENVAYQYKKKEDKQVTPPKSKKEQYLINNTASEVFEAMLLSALITAYYTDIKKTLRKIENDYYNFKRLA